jgi:hypothetical protein
VQQTAVCRLRFADCGLQFAEKIKMFATLPILTCRRVGPTPGARRRWPRAGAAELPSYRRLADHRQSLSHLGARHGAPGVLGAMPHKLTAHGRIMVRPLLFGVPRGMPQALDGLLHAVWGGSKLWGTLGHLGQSGVGVKNRCRASVAYGGRHALAYRLIFRVQMKNSKTLPHSTPSERKLRVNPKPFSLPQRGAPRRRNKLFDRLLQNL